MLPFFWEKFFFRNFALATNWNKISWSIKITKTEIQIKA